MKILGGFYILDYATNENQPAFPDEPVAKPFLRIAFPVWRMPRTRKQAGEEDRGVTRDEISSIFGTELVSRRVSKLNLTESERNQLDVNEKLRSALNSH